MNFGIRSVLVFFVPLVLLTSCSRADNLSQNGFDLANSEIPIEKIHGGGPARDGIPSIDNPRFLTIGQAEGELADSDPILGVEIDGVSRAYPVAIMNWHEIVNDEINGVEMKIYFDEESSSAWTTNQAGEKLPAVSSFWFAWMAFHPESEVYHVGE